MNRCPISYETIESGQYAISGLRLLSKSLMELKALPYSAQEQRQEAANRMKRMSIQGVQPKLSAVLDVRQATFKVVGINSKYIIKPQNDIYLQLPENEDVSMRMASLIGIEVPLHGMVYSRDGSLSYFIKRFDRIKNNKKLALEDFAQLAGKNRDTKYDYTTEKVIKLINEYCTFPVIEKYKFFRLILFCFLIGNEDMHLKNFSLITRNMKVELSPAYDLLNTTLAMDGAEEELALSLAGKRKEFKTHELIDYFGREKLQLTEKSIQAVLHQFVNIYPRWEELIQISFLSEAKKKGYLSLLKERFKRLHLL